ncbi:MAG: DEAD/DEAH box helicase [Sphingomonadales bacterium]
MSFEFLGLSAELLKAVNEAGYSAPTPIQSQAIPTVLMGRDVLGIAQTGTGKTASFTLPMLDILAQGRARARMPRSLILEPTRELAAQVAESFDKYGLYTSLSKALLIGGVSFEDQVKKLDRGVDVLIATPGRLLDHFERGKLMLTGVEILVIDEADRMLDMGFIPDVERIRSLIPTKPQILFFSATMPSEIRLLSQTFLDDPKEIAVAPPSSTVDTISQHLAIISRRDKEKAVNTLVRSDDVATAIIFCNRKKEVALLGRSLGAKGLAVGALHGDMDQYQRMEVLSAFKSGEISILVASDVAARGLDIPSVTHVINFDVPMQAEDYVHRIGRTGRAGREGTAITLATPGDALAVAAITKLTGKEIPLIEVPDVGTCKLDEDEGPRRRPGKKKKESAPKKAPAKKPAPGKKAMQRPPKRRGAPDLPASTTGMGPDLPAFIRRTIDRKTAKADKE